jgi:uncharacterized protein YndB with AHSA1/START domain
MQRLHFEHEFDAPKERVYDWFAEHEHLAVLFPAKITRLKDGDDGTRNGVGSVRRLKIGPLPAFEETVTKAVPGEVIEYKITKGSPLKDHHGRQTFTSTPSGGTKLVYDIEFGSKVPGLDAIVAKSLGGAVKAGLPKAAAQV